MCIEVKRKIRIFCCKEYASIVSSAIFPQVLSISSLVIDFMSVPTLFVRILGSVQQRGNMILGPMAKFPWDIFDDTALKS
jgi:hypothetical protein